MCPAIRLLGAPGCIFLARTVIVGERPGPARFQVDGRQRVGLAERNSSDGKEAHRRHLWIRFYTLNGHAPEASAANGWTRSYNFGSLDAVRQRWRAAIATGVDFVATDQYEEFTRELKSK